MTPTELTAFEALTAFNGMKEALGLILTLHPAPMMYHGVTKDCPYASFHGGPCPGHADPDEPIVARARAALALADKVSR